MGKYKVEFVVELRSYSKNIETVVGVKRADLRKRGIVLADESYTLSYPISASVTAETREEAVKALLREFWWVSDVYVFESTGQVRVSNGTVHSLMKEVEVEVEAEVAGR